jgi:hypothetical protein
MVINNPVAHTPGAPPPGVAVPMPPLPNDLDGNYTLSEVGGMRIPAAVDSAGGCMVRVVAGSLSLSDRHFTYSQTTERRCGTGPASTTAQRASGHYDAVEASVTLTADAADSGAFSVAEVAMLGRGTLQVTRFATGAGVRGADWRFVNMDRRRR